MKKESVVRDIKSNIELRELEDGKKTITGLIPYNSRSEYMGWFYEYIAPTAFNKTLADGKDVRALVDHDSSKVIGRVANGSLRLTSREDGLFCECDLPNTSYARDLYELIKNDYVTTMSFGFRIIEQDYGVDDAGIETHTLREVALEEVSFGVTFPAYKETKSEARSLEKISNLLDKEELDDSDKSELRDFIDKLNSKLEVREEPAPVAPETIEAVDNTSTEQEEEQFILTMREQLRALRGE